jgi:hypothetical protein
MIAAQALLPLEPQPAQRGAVRCDGLLGARISVCLDPQCDAVYFGRKETRCADCDGRLVKINAETYRKKYAGNLVQYDQNLNVLTNAPNAKRSDRP